MFLKHHHSIAPRYYSGHCSSWLTASYVGEQLPDVLWLAVTSIASGHLWSTSLASSGTTKRFLATTKTFAFASYICMTCSGPRCGDKLSTKRETGKLAKRFTLSMCVIALQVPVRCLRGLGLGGLGISLSKSWHSPMSTASDFA